MIFNNSHYLFDICFGTDFWWFIAPFGGPCWNTVGVIFHVLSRSICEWTSGCNFNPFCKSSYKSMNIKRIRRGSSRLQPPFPIFLHTCESYSGKAHKCAVIRKKYSKEALDSESYKVGFGSNVGLFWGPVGSLLFLFEEMLPFPIHFCIGFANILRTLKIQLTIWQVNLLSLRKMLIDSISANLNYWHFGNYNC